MHLGLSSGHWPFGLHIHHKDYRRPGLLVLLQGKICTWEWIRELPLNLSHFLWDDLKEGILGPLRWDSGAILINISVNRFIKKSTHFTYLVLNGLTHINLLTLSTIPATDAINFSPSTYVPWPLQQREITSQFQMQKKKTQGRWVVHRVSKQTKNQSNHIDKLEQMEKSNLQLSVDCIGFVLLHSLFGPEYLCHLLK